MKTISMHRKYSICTTYLDTMLEHSVEIREGESKTDAYKRGLKELDEIAEVLRRDVAPQHAVSVQQSTNNPTSVTVSSNTSEPLTINLQHERLKDSIDDCQSIETLQEWKSNNPVVPFPILKHFNKKMEELSNGK